MNCGGGSLLLKPHCHCIVGGRLFSKRGIEKCWVKSEEMTIKSSKKEIGVKIAVET